MAFRFGEKLTPLCEQGVLVAGSGNIVHNLRTMRCEPAGGYGRAIDFRNTVNRALTVRDNDTLVHYERLVEAAALSVSPPPGTLPAAALHRHAARTAGRYGNIQ